MHGTNSNPRVVNSLVDDTLQGKYGFIEEDIDVDDGIEEPWNEQDIFELIKDIADPEHPLTLQQLNVARLDGISVDLDTNTISVAFTPTIPHCSMATLIGLSLQVKLLRSLPRRFKLNVTVSKGSYTAEDTLNKQLNDKERVAAALENNQLLRVVNTCIENS